MTNTNFDTCDHARFFMASTIRRGYSSAIGREVCEGCGASRHVSIRRNGASVKRAPWAPRQLTALEKAMRTPDGGLL